MVAENKVIELVEVLEHAESACEVMAETVTNSIEAAKLKWASGDSGPLSLEKYKIADLISVVRQVQKRHHTSVIYHVWILLLRAQHIAMTFSSHRH